MKKPDLELLDKGLTDLIIRYLSLAQEDGKGAEFVEALKLWIFENISIQKSQPIDYVRWIPVDDVIANDYNPNAVAQKEMQLLHKSIKSDGYTQPVVVVWDESKNKFVIVDGFHRTTVMKNYKDIQETTGKMLPCVVIEKDINERMASTVRHNRARGTHSVVGMSDMVFSMLERGMGDADVANELGMEKEEIVRLKHITGFSKLFADKEYSKAWETKNQILLRKKYETENSNAGIAPKQIEGEQG